MDSLFEYLYQDLGRIARALGELWAALVQLLVTIFDFSARLEILQAYRAGFTTRAWVLVLLVELTLGAGCLALLVLGVRLLRKGLLHLLLQKRYRAMEAENRRLQRTLVEAQLRHPVTGSAQTVADGPRNTLEGPCIDPDQSRFFRLTTVDNTYKQAPAQPLAPVNLTLEALCDRFRRYAASRLGLYYDIGLIRCFFAALGTARILILQGISGTGKTSLPYAFGQFVGRGSTVVPVQPSWRERTELYGYFNEFTHSYVETEFLRAVYEANLFPEPHLVILDEMNIARVEYYFAEMLSLLELPQREARRIPVVSATWPNDPCLLEEGRIQVPDNLWFVGTINNDDSTYSVADKVYDRAIPLDLNGRAEPFSCPEADGVSFSYEELTALYTRAKGEYALSQEAEGKLDQLNRYLMEDFHLSFGNRVLRQLRDFVPIFLACGGTELEALDFILAQKVLRKLDSLNLSAMGADLERLEAYLSRLFGKGKMPQCQNYLRQLQSGCWS